MVAAVACGLYRCESYEEARAPVASGGLASGIRYGPEFIAGAKL